MSNTYMLDEQGKKFYSIKDVDGYVIQLPDFICVDGLDADDAKRLDELFKGEMFESSYYIIDNFNARVIPFEAHIYVYEATGELKMHWELSFIEPEVLEIVDEMSCDELEQLKKYIEQLIENS